MEKFSDIKYTRPDFKKFKAEVKAALKEYNRATSYEEQKKVLLHMEEIMAAISDMVTVASIRNTMDTSDKFYDDEMTYIRQELAKLTSLQQKEKKAKIKSAFRGEFDREYGPLLNYDAEQQLKLLSVKIIPEMIKEGNLTQEYSKTAAACKTTFRGEEVNFYGLLKHMQSTDRAERKEAFEAWAALYESTSEKLDKQYDELCALRVKMAKKLKMESYVEQAYLTMQRYDYNRDNVAVFRKQVVDVIVPAVKKLYEEQAQRIGVDKLHYYDEQLIFPEGNAVPVGTTAELVEKARKMYEELSPETAEFFNFMAEYELFDLETKPNKHMGGYMTFLPERKAPFIFSNFNGTSADVDVLTHEAGHAFQGYIAARTLPFSDMCGSTSEINEIHSMTMEHFTYPWMESFFGDKADKYRYAHLTEALKTIPYLVAVDEFQHEVFRKEVTTASERRAIWHTIEEKYLPWRDYDGNKFLEEGGFWMQKQHIFMYPFYYIDYALAQICAFQFYVKSLENKEQAWNDYLNLCKAGGSQGYFCLLKLAKLDNPFEEGTVKKVVDAVVKQIEVLKEKI